MSTPNKPEFIPIVPPRPTRSASHSPIKADDADHSGSNHNTPEVSVNPNTTSRSETVLESFDSFHSVSSQPDELLNEDFEASNIPQLPLQRPVPSSVVNADLSQGEYEISTTPPVPMRRPAKSSPVDSSSNSDLEVSAQTQLPLDHEESNLESKERITTTLPMVPKRPYDINPLNEDTGSLSPPMAGSTLPFIPERPKAPVVDETDVIESDEIKLSQAQLPRTHFDNISIPHRPAGLVTDQLDSGDTVDSSTELVEAERPIPVGGVALPSIPRRPAAAPVDSSTEETIDSSSESVKTEGSVPVDGFALPSIPRRPTTTSVDSSTGEAIDSSTEEAFDSSAESAENQNSIPTSEFALPHTNTVHTAPFTDEIDGLSEGQATTEEQLDAEEVVHTNAESVNSRSPTDLGDVSLPAIPRRPAAPVTEEFGSRTGSEKSVTSQIQDTQIDVPGTSANSESEVNKKIQDRSEDSVVNNEMTNDEIRETSEAKVNPLIPVGGIALPILPQTLVRDVKGDDEDKAVESVGDNLTSISHTKVTEHVKGENEKENENENEKIPVVESLSGGDSLNVTGVEKLGDDDEHKYLILDSEYNIDNTQNFQDVKQHAAVNEERGPTPTPFVPKRPVKKPSFSSSTPPQAPSPFIPARPSSIRAMQSNIESMDSDTEKPVPPKTRPKPAFKSGKIAALSAALGSTFANNIGKGRTFQPVIPAPVEPELNRDAEEVIAANTHITDTASNELAVSPSEVKVTSGLGDARRSRAKGPRGRKLPSEMISCWQVSGPVDLWELGVVESIEKLSVEGETAEDKQAPTTVTDIEADAGNDNIELDSESKEKNCLEVSNPSSDVHTYSIVESTLEEATPDLKESGYVDTSGEEPNITDIPTNSEPRVEESTPTEEKPVSTDSEDEQIMEPTRDIESLPPNPKLATALSNEPEFIIISEDLDEEPEVVAHVSKAFSSPLASSPPAEEDFVEISDDEDVKIQ